MIKAKILVVEDEAIIGMEIESNLRNLGYEVISVVTSSDDAIKITEENKPDLILMDIRIKGEKDGIETAEIIRNNFGIPIVFSTAFLDEERIQRAKITMPFGYVLKPIQDRDLKVTIEMALYVAKVDAERRAVEEKLKKSEELLNETGELARIGSWEVDTMLNTVYWSQATKKIKEVPPDYEPKFGEYVNFYPGESGQLIKKASEDAISEGKDYNLELDFITAKGNSLIVRSIGHAHFENGRCTRVYGTIQDITHQRKNQLTLQKIIDATFDGIVVNVNGKHEYCNQSACDILGYSKKELQNTGIEDLIHKDEQKTVLERNKRRLAGEDLPQQYETIAVHKTGRNIPISLKSTIVEWHGLPAALVIFRVVKK